MARTPIRIPVGPTLLLALAIVCIAYSVVARHVDDHVRYPFRVAWVASAPFLFAAVAVLVSAGRRPTNVRQFVSVIGFLFFYTWTLYGLRELLLDAADWLRRPDLNRPIAFLVVTAAASTIGGMLFLIRLHMRFMYGLSEVVAGLAVSTHKVVTEFSSLTQVTTGWSLAFLTAGIYLIVRGLDNMHQGTSKEPLDRVLIWLARFLPWSTRGAVWSQYSLLLRDLEAAGAVPGRVFGRPCINFSDSSRVVRKHDYLGREVRVNRTVSFLAVDDDRLVFRLAGEARTAALALTGAGEWDPSATGRPVSGWVAVPLMERQKLVSLARQALLAVADSGADV